jgi:Zn2+/Cd2+-exporting ATPase
MAHDYIKDGLQTEVEHKTGRVGLEILATLFGGVLLICSALADYFADGTIGNGDFYTSVLAAIAAILLGAPLIVVAFRDLAHGHMHMNELVALAVLAAFAQGWYQESAAIAFFMILSVLIESRSALGARASIEALIRITPTRAFKIHDDHEHEVEAKDLKTGDVVRVRPGDNIPADGKVLRGESTVNQANITGESLPVDKQIGDEVFGGTINVTGVLEVEVTKAGSDTTLGRVKDLIIQAEGTRIPIARMIDRYAGWYTPVVIMITFIVWWFLAKDAPDEAANRAIAMLVIACPCALILATPTAMVAALSAAARLGVLVKSVTDLEAARNLTAMVFDKTGTLTTGQLEVTRLSPVPGVEGAELLRITASVEQNSKHPVARAVIEVARKARIPMTQPASFEEVAGRGVKANLDGSNIAIGRGNWLIETGSLTDDAAQAIRAIITSPEADGVSVLCVVRDGNLLGWVGLADNTRPEAVGAIDKLRELGLKRLIIVTGDRESVAKRVAAQMHTEYKAEVLPHQKLEMVDELKAKGHRVAVIGDGVNDAPALAAGDISIAMGAAGSDVAIHSASIALMNNNLNRIPFLIELSRKTSAIVWQNIVIGAGFIFLFLGLSAAGYVTPIMAAIFHVLSSLVVVFNSARLVRMGEDIELAESQALQRRTQAARPTPAATPAAGTTPATA